MRAIKRAVGLALCDRQGRTVTNYHVVENAEELLLTLSAKCTRPIFLSVRRSRRTRRSTPATRAIVSFNSNLCFILL